MAFLHAITSWINGMSKYWANVKAPLPVEIKLNFLSGNFSNTSLNNSFMVFFVSEKCRLYSLYNISFLEDLLIYLECNNIEKDKYEQFEEEQEKNAIISYNELKKSFDKLYTESERIQYLEDDEIPINIEELYKLQKIEKDVEELGVKITELQSVLSSLTSRGADHNR